jgi:uncharacterized membrane protein YeaQ/YmgE (transglycosylase-associated protein family)
MGHIIGLIIVGLIVGALGRFFHRGPDPMGLLLTIGIGVVSSLVVGLILSGVLGFILAVIVAVVLVGVVSAATPRHTVS